MNHKLVTLENLKKFKEEILQKAPIYQAGYGITIKNGIISIERTKIGNPTCPGYTLHGDYFLSNNAEEGNWETAISRNAVVTVTQAYNYDDEIKTVTAHTLSKEELETILPPEERKLKIDDTYYTYWTNTLFNEYTSDAYAVNVGGDFVTVGKLVGDNMYIRLGFKNPFI